MTFNDIQKANSTIKTTPIKGKDYAEVNQRIKAFRMICPEGTIQTSMISNDLDADMKKICIFRAEVLDESGRLLGTGTAYEVEGSSNINRTSYIENCETSAIGRALAMCGIGIDTSIASYEEVSNAIIQQGESAKDNPVVAEAKVRASVIKYCNEHYNADQIKDICKKYKVKSLSELTTENCGEFKNLIEARGGKLGE